MSPAAHVADCGGLLQAAGFALPTVDVDTITVHFVQFVRRAWTGFIIPSLCNQPTNQSIVQVTYPDAFVLMEHLQGMGESSAVLTRRAHVSRETFLAAATVYQELYGEEDGSVPATFQVVYMIGWAPHASQPLPKRRGSAQVSMKTLGREGEEGCGAGAAGGGGGCGGGGGGGCRS